MYINILNYQLLPPIEFNLFLIYNCVVMDYVLSYKEKEAAL